MEKDQRDLRRKLFYKRYLKLCGKMSYQLAYCFSEKVEKHKHGTRLYKNYNSFKSAKVYHAQKSS